MNAPLHILWRDEHLVALYKPAGWLVHRTGLDAGETRFVLQTLRDQIGQRDIIAQLVRMQYQRNELEFTRGKFRVRGDTIDIFPAEHSELALRIELFDDEIETLQLFDPLTGKIRQKLPRFTVYPSSHYVTPREQVLAAVETIKTELAERLEYF